MPTLQPRLWVLNKIRVTIRLDADIVKHFKDQVHKAGAGNYQTLINDTLREAISEDRTALDESTLRKVLKEELSVLSK